MKILLFDKPLVLFSLLLISIVLSLNFIDNSPSMLLFKHTNAQTFINSTATESQNQTAAQEEEVFIVQNTSIQYQLQLDIPVSLLTK